MQIVRTIAWVLLLVVLLVFSINNWNPVEVTIWDGLVLETKVPALVVLAFLLGLVPMWLLHQATRWRLQRRIAGLESAARAAAMPAPPATPIPMAGAAPPSPAPDAPPQATAEPQPRSPGADSHGPREA